MVSFDEMINAVEAGLGTPIRRFPLPPAGFRAIGRIADAASRIVPVGAGLTYEAAWLLTEATPTDDSATLADLAMTWRSPTAAITESFRG